MKKAVAVLAIVMIAITGLLIPVLAMGKIAYTENECINFAVSYMHLRHPETKGYSPISVQSVYKPCSYYEIKLTYENSVAFEWTGKVNRWSGCVCEQSFEFAEKPEPSKIGPGTIKNIIPFDGFPTTIGIGLPATDVTYRLKLILYDSDDVVFTCGITIRPGKNWVAVNIGSNTVNGATHATWIAPTWNLTTTL